MIRDYFGTVIKNMKVAKRVEEDNEITVVHPRA